MVDTNQNSSRVCDWRCLIVENFRLEDLCVTCACYDTVSHNLFACQLQSMLSLLWLANHGKTYRGVRGNRTRCHYPFLYVILKSMNVGLSICLIGTRSDCRSCRRFPELPINARDFGDGQRRVSNLRRSVKSRVEIRELTLPSSQSCEANKAKPTRIPPVARWCNTKTSYVFLLVCNTSCSAACVVPLNRH